MEPATTIVDKLLGFAKSTQDFAQKIHGRGRNTNRRNPIQILKRLQREAFSDIMKLRDRQDKVEKILAFYKTTNAGPFEEAGTRVKGSFDVLGGFFLMNGVDEQKCDAVKKSGIRTGIDAKLSFETALRENGSLVAEFVGSGKGNGDMLGGALSLSKLFYSEDFNNSFSAIAIPVGATCRDVSVTTNTRQERGLTDYSEFGPPLLNQQTGSGIGIMLRNSNMIGSLAQFISGGIERSLSTFGQIAWRVSENTKVGILGVHKRSRPSNQNITLGALTFPLSLNSGFFKTSMNGDSQVNTGQSISDSSVAMTFEREVNESMRVGGWVERKNSNPKNLQWSASVCDTPEGEFGWGLTAGGLFGDSKRLDHFQVESFLNINFGKKFKLQPAFVYVKDGDTQFPALMLRCSWSV